VQDIYSHTRQLRPAMEPAAWNPVPASTLLRAKRAEAPHGLSHAAP
jgi:hypothetical protein